MVYLKETTAFLEAVLDRALPPPRNAKGGTVLTIPTPSGAEYSFGIELIENRGRVFAVTSRDPSLEVWDAHALDEFNEFEFFSRIVLQPFGRMIRSASRVHLSSRLLGVGTRLEVLEGDAWATIYGGGLVVVSPWHPLRRLARLSPVLSAPALI